MNFSRRHFFFGTFALPAVAAPPAAGPANVVLFLAENFPAWMLGCYGNKEVATPNIDRLAHTGTRFVNHIAVAPTPDAARAALLSGRLGGGTPLDAAFGRAGYATATTDAAGAAAFLNAQSAAKPFLLTVSLGGFAPPYPDAAKFLARYAGARFDTFEKVAPSPSIAAGKERFGDNLLPSLREAAAAATALDDATGAILATLSQKKLLDGTVVVFTAPTGSLIGRHGLWGGSAASDPPNFYEEVIATPMIWSFPVKVVPSGSRPEMASALDLVPTLAELTRAGIAENSTGRSYVQLLQNKPLPKKEPWRNTAFVVSGTSGVARDDRYKLVLRNDGKGPNELYDLKMDPRERVNQFDNLQFLTVKNELTGQLKAWRQKNQA